MHPLPYKWQKCLWKKVFELPYEKAFSVYVLLEKCLSLKCMTSTARLIHLRCKQDYNFQILSMCCFFVVKHILRQLHKRKFPCERDPSDVAYAAPKICSTFDGFHFLNFLGSLCHSWQFLQSLCESWSLMTQTAKIIDFYSLFNQLYIHPELTLDTRSYQCWLAGPDCNSLKCRRCALDFKCLYSPHHVSQQSMHLTSV